MAAEAGGEGMERRRGLPPVIGTAPRALLLGTVPSVISDRERQYYANPMNGFWKVTHGIWDAEPDADYAARLEFLKAHRLALWDVVQECDIRKSGDGSIRNAVPNDLEGLFRDHPTIGRVFINGRRAHSLYEVMVDRHMDPVLRRPFSYLPSTSSANAIGFGRKKEAWMMVRTYVERG